MWGHHWFHPGWGFLLVFVGFLIFRVLTFRRHGWGCHHWHHGHDDALAILRRRLVNGEIDEAEYQRLKEALNK